MPAPVRLTLLICRMSVSTGRSRRLPSACAIASGILFCPALSVASTETITGFLSPIIARNCRTVSSFSSLLTSLTASALSPPLAAAYSGSFFRLPSPPLRITGAPRGAFGAAFAVQPALVGNGLLPFGIGGWDGGFGRVFRLPLPLCQPVGELFFDFGDVVAGAAVGRPDAEGGFAVAGICAATGCPAFGRALADKVCAGRFAVAPVINALVQYAAGAAGLYGGQAGLGKPVIDGLAGCVYVLFFGKPYGIAPHYEFYVRTVSDGFAVFVVFVAHTVLRLFTGFDRHKAGQARPAVHFGLSPFGLPCRADKAVVLVQVDGVSGCFACFPFGRCALRGYDGIIE